MAAIENESEIFMSFCVEAVTSPANFRASNGVLRKSAFSIIADATIAAEKILKEAEEQAQLILEQANTEAQNAVHHMEQDTFERAQQLLQALENERTVFLERAQDMVIELGQTLFERLVLETTPKQRLEASFKRIVREAPPKLAGALLRVHPDDFDYLPSVEWERKADASLSPGMCRLEATNGEWCADFNAAVSALKAAFTEATQGTA
jgi:flagellar biosynthesis/type III secretory pathway protein FliH